ncbi:MAG: 4-hydroxy-tetrahydrodipicolinate synthase [Alphaproteobacteria bacterium]|nr:4-hydroxy-tetrahydrodipicolinate synthase [Alphaproteobacteria bacterium]
MTRLSGYLSAVPTPFRYGQVDADAFEAFCDWQIAHGIGGLVVCGTTGEAPTLSAAEQRHVIARAVDVAHGQVPVIAGAGANATDHAIDLARAAQSAGADGLLVVVPYYNRPPQEGLYRHFRAVHDAVDIPIVLYDVPARTGCALADDTVARLAMLPRIVGLKDATGDLDRPTRLRARLGDAFRLLTGEDANAAAYLEAGGDGCISVVSNVAPRLCADLYKAWTIGDLDRVAALAPAIGQLSEVLFLESNPIPVKYALGLMRWMSPAVRLPLCDAAEATRQRVAACLHGLSIERAGPLGRVAPALAPVA